MSREVKIRVRHWVFIDDVKFFGPLAIEKDGGPLPNGEGPFRLIAPQDKKQARWIREIR